MFRKSQSPRRGATKPNTLAPLNSAAYEQTLFWLIGTLRKHAPDSSLKDRIQSRINSEWQDAVKPPSALLMVLFVALFIVSTAAISRPDR